MRALGALAICAGCYTTTNVAALTPLETAYPVSASSQYVDRGGNVVADADYDVVHSFGFHHAVEARPHVETVSTLPLVPDLDRIMSTTQGDAITGLTIQAVNYDPGSHYPAAGMRMLGWTFGVSGAALVALSSGSDGEDGPPFVTGGLVMIGLGVASYLIGTAMDTPASWQLDVTGNVVRRRQAPRPAR